MLTVQPREDNGYPKLCKCDVVVSLPYSQGQLFLGCSSDSGYKGKPKMQSKKKRKDDESDSRVVFQMKISFAKFLFFSK